MLRCIRYSTSSVKMKSCSCRATEDTFVFSFRLLLTVQNRALCYQKLGRWQNVVEDAGAQPLPMGRAACDCLSSMDTGCTATSQSCNVWAGAG